MNQYTEDFPEINYKTYNETEDETDTMLPKKIKFSDNFWSYKYGFMSMYKYIFHCKKK
tara:strand:- start:346 stop:519 length:174 start_codon:yes stop_codon:yes gene_type:complete